MAVNLLALGANNNTITFSGFSSGAFMTHQMHVIHSSYIKGVGLVSPGPYNSNLDFADYNQTSGSGGLTQIAEEKALKNEKNHLIDPLSNIKDKPVFIVEESRDHTVNMTAAVSVEKFY